MGALRLVHSPTIRNSSQLPVSVRPTTATKVMNLQNYVKYLVCVLFGNFQSVYTETSSLDSIDNRNDLKQTRGFIDLVLGRLRPCGTCLCGRANHGRFLGGEYTDSHEHPWLAHVYLRSKKMFNGVLINDRYVLTAASPLINATAGEIKVALGQYNRCHNDLSSANSSVEAVIQHPAFDYISRARDLALLHLSRPIKFERRILPVCLPNPGSEYLGQVGTLIGWSDKNDSKDNLKACRPRKVGLPILGKKECFKAGVESSTFHSDSGCIGVIGADPVACSNDAGSSVLYRSYYSVYDLVGILTDVNDCDDDDVGTAVYTKIGPHLDWILQNTKDSCYCTK